MLPPSKILRLGYQLCMCGLLCLLVACAGRGDRQTLAGLRSQQPDLEEAEVAQGIDQAMAGYRKFLEEAPKSSLTPEAMRRLADLKLEKQYGSLEPQAATVAGSKNASRASALPAPKVSVLADSSRSTSSPAKETPANPATESPQDFEARALGGESISYASADPDGLHPDAQANSSAGPLEAIALYDNILTSYPDYAHNDRVLYQKSRALDELGRVDEAIAVSALLVARFPTSEHLDEIQFRRGEYFFTRKKFIEAEGAYESIVHRGGQSEYYELALYKLGWTFYKQMFFDEALGSYIELLDHKVATGYDFDQTEDDAQAQRIADIYRVTSLCFSDLGGATSVTKFFNSHGSRSYEDRIYRELGEFYLEKLRYNDAAIVYQAFVDLYPIHEVAPHFSMRIVEIYEAGNFPRLVLEAKKSFAANYGLRSAYWQHFDVESADAVRGFLKENLGDLANHYHALYQTTETVEERPAHFAESTRWYRKYLESFPTDPETPSVHNRFADLMLENEAFGAAAVEYELIAYDYPRHEQSDAAGYAAVFARRQHLARAIESEEPTIRREIVASSLRFADTFPEHENAAPILAAAVDDLYTLEDYAAAITNGHRLIESYPDASQEILRGAWTAVAHASFDSGAFEPAEQAYSNVLALAPADDESVAKITDNLAAAIYKQAEAATSQEDHRAAADHFLRIAAVAPNSEIRPLAEYDAAAALVRIEDWDGASQVLEDFRATHPDHELNPDATQQLAYVYREGGQSARAAAEYERVAKETDDPELRRESLLVAGELYEDADELPLALKAYEEFVTNFLFPIEPAVVTRYRMAELHEKMGNESARRSEFERIVAIEAKAGDQITPTVRSLAGQSALHLAEPGYDRFAAIELTQPFDVSLRRKRSEMERALGRFESLLDYGVGEVTAAATFYMAEIYGEFSRALIDSERPTDLDANALIEYEDMLEEEAFPFEERAIAVHRKNLELMSSGVFNEWIEKSLGQLAELMPGRYAKHEISIGMMGSIDSYAYQAPIPSVVPETIVADVDVPVEAEVTNTSDAEAKEVTTAVLSELAPPAVAPFESDAEVPAAPDDGAARLEPIGESDESLDLQ